MSGFTAEFGTTLLLIKRNVGDGLNRKDRAVRVRRGNLYATAMRQRNGAAERKTQAHAAMAVGKTVVGGVERLKDSLAVLGRNARASSSATEHATRPSSTPIEITICEPAGV